jgi:hypothetical protein
MQSLATSVLVDRDICLIFVELNKSIDENVANGDEIVLL